MPLLFLLSVAAAVSPAAGSDAFEQWAAKYKRTYRTAAAEAKARAAWSEYRVKIADATRANPHAVFEVDEHADYSAEDLAGLRGGPLQPKGAAIQPAFDEVAVRAALASGPIDWVERGAVNTPISQGRCGTCAQFSATADVEAQWFLAGNGLIKLSEQA